MFDSLASVCDDITAKGTGESDTGSGVVWTIRLALASTSSIGGCSPSAQPWDASYTQPMDTRAAGPDEIPALARLWYDGWQDAHAAILPEALARVRTLESFRERLVSALSDTRVVGPRGAPLGLCMLKGDELYQLYVSAEARGTGVAAALIADAESRLAAKGVEIAWLACAIGNDRAARFYEKSGWQRAGTFVSTLDTINGPFDLEVWRYEKYLKEPHPQ